MVNVRISEEDLLDLLCSRVEYWTKDKEEQDLFRQMYDNMVYGGVFEGCDFNVACIVDNDYVNNCSIIGVGDEDYDLVVDTIKKGEREIVDSGMGYSYVESYSEDMSKVLVRW